MHMLQMCMEARLVGVQAAIESFRNVSIHVALDGQQQAAQQQQRGKA
jgi:hypothetical protein